MIARAMKEANKSTFKQQLGALLVKGGRLLATGYNRVGEHNKLINPKWPGSIHAEEDAIASMLKHGKEKEIKGSTMYVVRVGHKLAKPCSHCMNTLMHYGVKKVVFTTDTGVETLWLK
jgi:deoxycytidylate deaminase